MSHRVYRSRPLRDPTQEIRLLEIQSSRDHEHYKLQAWPLAHAPKYAAISYTWGQSHYKSNIFIDGQPFFITRNARCALRQVSPRATEHEIQHVWMDAICINQDSLLEKNAQVPLMGKIYATASKVFACVGEHADDSREVMLAAIHNRAVETAPDNVVRFFSRFYWTRVWIVQELFQASDTPIVLCGDLHVSLFKLSYRYGPRNDEFWSEDFGFYDSAIGRITQLCEADRDGPRRIVNTERHHLGSLITSLSDLTCTNPRDRIYGLSSIVAWPKDLPSLVVDYTISLVQLLLNAFPYIQYNRPTPVNRVRLLLRAFAIDGRADVATMHSMQLATRAQLGYDRPKYRVRPAQSLRLGERYAPGVWLDTTSGYHFGPSIDFLHWRELGVQISGGRHSGRLIVFESCDSSPTTLVGFTCSAAQPGDWLLCVGNDEIDSVTTSYWLIARSRPADKQTLDIVSNAWIDVKWSPYLPSENAVFEVAFEALDYITFVAEHLQIHAQISSGIDIRDLDSAKLKSHVVMVRDMEPISDTKPLARDESINHGYPDSD